jgi:hypothetical protein
MHNVSLTGTFVYTDFFLHDRSTGKIIKTVSNWFRPQHYLTPCAIKCKRDMHQYTVYPEKSTTGISIITWICNTFLCPVFFFVILNYSNFLLSKHWDWVVNGSADITEIHKVQTEISSHSFVHCTQTLCNVLSISCNQGLRRLSQRCCKHSHKPQDMEKSDSMLTDNHGQHQVHHHSWDLWSNSEECEK